VGRLQTNPVHVLANSAALPRTTGDQLVVQQGLPTKRVKGIEPSPKAWEAFVLPLNYTRRTASSIRAGLHEVKRLVFFLPVFSTNFA
jgi:hypothetical protein